MEEGNDHYWDDSKKYLKRRAFEIVADQTGKLFDPNIFTIVWARRFAGYKRASRSRRTGCPRSRRRGRSREDVDDRRQRRHVPDHRHRAVFRMQRQRDLVVDDQPVAPANSARPRSTPGDAGPLGLGDHARVVRVEEDAELRRVEVLVVLDRRRLEHRVGVVEHHADVAQPADAGLRAHGRDADLDARIAERALLGLAGLVVEVDLLVRAAGDALPPAAALVLVDQHDAVLAALVDRAGRARRRTRRVEAVLADPRQVEHESLLELELDLVRDCSDLGQHRVPADLLGSAAEVVVPVGAPRHLGVPAGDQRLGPGDRRGVHRRGATVGSRSRRSTGS